MTPRSTQTSNHCRTRHTEHAHAPMAATTLVFLYSCCSVALAWQSGFRVGKRFRLRSELCIPFRFRRWAGPCLSPREPRTYAGPPDATHDEDGESASANPTPVGEGGSGRRAYVDTAASSLLPLLSPPSPCRVEQMSSTDLAYIGDAVYELMVRSWAVWPPKRTSDLQTKVVGLVRAEHQARLLAHLRRASSSASPSEANGCDGTGVSSSFTLTADEFAVLQRGRNSVSGSSRNRRDPSAYQDATALEALIGFLYVTDARRCGALLDWIRRTMIELTDGELL